MPRVFAFISVLIWHTRTSCCVSSRTTTSPGPQPHFSPARQRMAAVTMATLPGARLFHEGQFEGRKVRPPVFLGRRPHEPLDRKLQSFYATLLGTINSPVFREGRVEPL